MINWITDKLGTASYYSIESIKDNTDAVIVDVRELTDREGNTTDLIRKKIQNALQILQEDKKVVICCDKGISRSNAIALGTLTATGMPYEKALSLVNDKTGSLDINLGLLHDIRSLFQSPKTESSKLSTNILITGSTGFIGQALTKALKSNYELFCPGRKKLDLIHNLPTFDAYINKNNIGCIVHLAHPRLRNNVSAMGEAISMMKNILEICRLNGVDLLYLSNVIIFSGHISNVPLKADSSLQVRPKGTYAETKFFCEELIRLYQSSWGINAAILRPGIVYGKDMDRAAFLSKFFELAIKGKTIHTHKYNNGLPLFDFLYLDDLIEVILLALSKRPEIPLNIGTGKATSTYALAQAIVKITNSPSSVKTIDIDDNVYKVIINPDEAEAHLDWRAKVDIDRGLRKLWQSYKK